VYSHPVRHCTLQAFSDPHCRDTVCETAEVSRFRSLDCSKETGDSGQQSAASKASQGESLA